MKPLTEGSMKGPVKQINTSNDPITIPVSHKNRKIKEIICTGGMVLSFLEPITKEELKRLMKFDGVR